MELDEFDLAEILYGVMDKPKKIRFLVDVQRAIYLLDTLEMEIRDLPDDIWESVRNDRAACSKMVLATAVYTRRELLRDLLEHFEAFRKNARAPKDKRSEAEMDDDEPAVKIDLRTALNWLPQEDEIHTFRSVGNMLLGCDRERASVIASLKEAKRIYIAPAEMRERGHGIAISDSAGPEFIECREDVNYTQFMN